MIDHINYSEKVRRIANAYEIIIEAMGCSLEDPNFKDTPKRAAKALLEINRGLIGLEPMLDAIMSKQFPTTYDESLVQPRIDAVSMCPHHLLPVLYTVSVGYVPNQSTEDVSVVGLSKLTRLTQAICARPVLQEAIAIDIADALENYIKPAGIGVIVRGTHGCMSCRGVLDRDNETITTCLRGVMKTNAQSRQEFFTLVNLRKV